MKPLLRHGVRIAAWLLIGLVCSLLHTWFMLNYENRYSTGWLKMFSQPYLIVDQSTTHWMIGESNADGDHWDILGVYNFNHRIHQVRYKVHYGGYTGLERAIKPGIIPSWSMVTSVPSSEDVAERLAIIEQLNGWPFPAWRGEARMTSQGIQYIRSIPAHEPMLGRAGWKGLVLFPYEPVFPGVVLNAGFFAGVLAAFAWVVRHYARRYIRWERKGVGLCPKCAYNTRGLTTCPECGEPVPERVPKRNTIGS